MTTISISKAAGAFAEDKDVARNLRRSQLMPVLKQGGEVVLDFAGVDVATQSFIHALVSDVIRQLGSDVLDRITFEHCNEVTRSLIEIVTEYSQEGLHQAAD
jgi:hypothetical protein